MMDTMQASMGPEETPAMIRYLIIATAGLSLFCALFQNLFTSFGWSNPQYWFSLSWYTVGQGHIWKLITFILLYPSAIGGLSFSYLIMLGLSLYILWVMGTAVYERIGEKGFLILYFGSGLAAGWTTALLMWLFGSYGNIAGPGPAILGVLTIWMLLNPDATLFLFFLFPIKAKWLVTGILGAILLVQLSSGSLIGICNYLLAPLFAYLYGVMGWGLHSPFTQLHKLEENLITLSPSNSKIIKLRPSKRDISDEAFMDAMLTKISQKGEESLSWWEKRRMRKISQRNHHSHS